MASPSAAARSGPPVAGPVKSRRNTELALVVGAVLIAVFGYVEVGANIDGKLPSGAVGYGAALGVLALLAHGVVRWKAAYADPLLLPIAILLNGIGLVVIYRLDRATPKSAAAPTQLLWSALGMALFIGVVILLRDHKILQRYAYIGALAALVLMVLPIFFPPVYGARIWIKAGPLSLQPGEFAKVLLAVFFAAYLAVHRDALALTGRRVWRFQFPRGRVLGPLLLIWAVSVGVLVLETDLGQSLLFFGLFVVMLYVATARTGWIAIGLILAASGVAVVGWLSPHVHSRVSDWLDPLGSIAAGQGANQIAQSLFAFAWGGVLGAGLGLGHSILIGFAAKSDFILATVGEELGLVGLVAVFLLYALLISRGFRTGVALKDPFGRLLAIGLAAIVGLQLFVVAGGVLDLIPLTGMTLPFIAQGGSSVVTNWIIVALLVRMSDVARRPLPEARP
ncbi:FtsW/RodA/SpoVE family cell cycle protein [Kitasatospora sp. MAP5-34]|uniref:FtsW/RodA/SpoVE family cell cycle protein n=1 Tax=Kitasatospora sp. MAP5-34 TaxID=3035102 RepID=UPI002476D55E|nr:FtsW/RodA/SpoVE family cell cycle protein [Kitasatospora sp. MAP5-34]MDH6577025.1 cell division protein FtsW (lipid II flippase) [Kitasatospora sp. MAP5-34]